MWNDPETVVGMLEHQFRALLAAEGARQLRMLPRLMRLLEREPLIGSALHDLHAEAERSLEDYINVCFACRNRVQQLWRVHGKFIENTLAGREESRLYAYGSPVGFVKALRARSVVQLPEYPLDDELRDEPTLRHMKAMRHWVQCMQPVDQHEANKSWRSPLLGELRMLIRRERTAFRSLRLESEGLGGFAAERLRGIVRRIHPTADDEVGHVADADLRHAVFAADGAAPSGRGMLQSACEAVVRDAPILLDEIRLRIVLGLSHHGVLQRYAAKCQAFRAAQLRKVAQGRAPERQLTLDLAGYLFDVGFTPLLDPEIAGLKPDIIDAAGSSLFYVEAKQYSDVRSMNKLVRAYRQVWSTWLRLENQHSLHEGFLVVFRRDGPLVELPRQLDYGHRRLHSILIDISSSAGSKERASPRRLDPGQLLPPTAADKKAVPSRRARAKPASSRRRRSTRERH